MEYQCVCVLFGDKIFYNCSFKVNEIIYCIFTLVEVRQNPGLIPGYSFLKQHSRQIPKLPESNNYE